MKNPLNATFESHYVGVLATYLGAATVSYYIGRSPLDYLFNDPLKAVGVLTLSEAALSLKKQQQVPVNANQAGKALEISDDSDSHVDSSDHEIKVRKQQALNRGRSPSRAAITSMTSMTSMTSTATKATKTKKNVPG